MYIPLPLPRPFVLTIPSLFKISFEISLLAADLVYGGLYLDQLMYNIIIKIKINFKFEKNNVYYAYYIRKKERELD